MRHFRPRTPLLVEGCAGMAAVTWAAFGAVPPVKYQGGKRGYAASILRNLRIHEPARVLLVEADPWVAAALRVCWDADLRATACRVYGVAGRDDEAGQRARWDRLRASIRDGSLTPDEHDAGIWWLWMRPRTVPFVQPHRASAGDWMRQVKAPSRTSAGSQSWALDAPRAALSAPLPAAEVDVVCSDVRDVEPVPGAVLYLDPPYVGTKGYGADLSRDGVLDVAHLWRAHGCVVGVSETCAMPGADERHVLARRGARGRNFADTPEALSVFWPVCATTKEGA